MTTKTKAALHRGNDSSAMSQKSAALGRSGSIVSDYGRGTLIAGLIIAITFGLVLVHAAVML